MLATGLFLSQDRKKRQQDRIERISHTQYILLGNIIALLNCNVKDFLLWR